MLEGMIRLHHWAWKGHVALNFYTKKEGLTIFRYT